MDVPELALLTVLGIPLLMALIAWYTDRPSPRPAPVAEAEHHSPEVPLASDGRNPSPYRPVEYN